MREVRRGERGERCRPAKFPEALGASTPPASGECRPRRSTASGRLAPIESVKTQTLRQRDSHVERRGPRSDRRPTGTHFAQRAHASSVAPVVITSSSNKTRKLSTRPPLRIAKAPRPGSERSSLRSRCFLGTRRAVPSARLQKQDGAI